MIETPSGPVWVKPSRLPELRNVDAIVFDCDGVLVDTRRSYDAAITETADQLLRLIAGMRLPWKVIGPTLISRLRRTGVFNNDWDSTYALTLFATLSLPRNIITKIAQGGSRSDAARKLPPSDGDMKAVAEKIEALVDTFCSSAMKSNIGWQAVNKFLQTKIADSVSALAIANAQERLGYPGSPPNCLLSTIFDEIYHGARLFQRMYKIKARCGRTRGLIENERLLIRRRDLDATNKLLGKGRLAVATGRPYLAAQHVLREIMNYFNREASIFIGDVDVHPELAPKLAKYRKPSGLSLIHARKVFSSDMLLYVGDSGEDVRMVKNAKRSSAPILFAGIYGRDEDGKSRFFREREADMILPEVRRIVPLLRSMKSEERYDREKN